MTRDFVSICAVFMEWWIAYLYYTNLYDKKSSQIATMAGSFGLYLIHMAAFVLINNSYLNAFLYFVINFLCAVLFYKTTWIKSIITSLILTALMGASEFIVIIFLSIFSRNDLNTTIQALPSFIIVVAISKTMLLLLSVFVSKIVFGHKIFNRERFPAFLLVFPVSALFIDFSFWGVCEGENTAYDIKVMVSIGSVVLLISILLTYAFYGNALRHSQELFQLQREYEKVQVDKEYYSILDNQNEELRTFIHDEKSHLTTLLAMSSVEEIHAYMNRILGDLQYTSRIGNTKNKMLDLILSKYISLCKIKNIRFTYTAITSNLSFMEDTDLVSLMSNILDNAMEAAETAENGWINLSLDSKVIGMTTLICKNTSGRIPVLQNGKIKTSKQNEEHHGIGIKSIVRIAKKYGGNYEWTWNESEMLFTVRIIFEH